VSFVYLTLYTYIISYLRFYQCLQGLKNLTEITFIISDRNRPIKKGGSFSACRPLVYFPLSDLFQCHIIAPFLFPR
jgi:hypothetical protein